jgi:hypothetical protein
VAPDVLGSLLCSRTGLRSNGAALYTHKGLGASPLEVRRAVLGGIMLGVNVNPLEKWEKGEDAYGGASSEEESRQPR